MATATFTYRCPAGYQLRNLGSYPTVGEPANLPPGSIYLGRGVYCAPISLYAPPPPPPPPSGQPPLPAGAQPAPERTNGNGGVETGGSCCNRCDGRPAPASGAVAAPGTPAAAAAAVKGKLDGLPWWVWVLGLMATAGAVK